MKKGTGIILVYLYYSKVIIEVLVSYDDDNPDVYTVASVKEPYLIVSNFVTIFASHTDYSETIDLYFYRTLVEIFISDNSINVYGSVALSLFRDSDVVNSLVNVPR